MWPKFKNIYEMADFQDILNEKHFEKCKFPQGGPTSHNVSEGEMTSYIN